MTVSAAYPLAEVRAQFPALEREVGGGPVAYLDSGASAQQVLASIDAVEKYAEEGRALHPPADGGRIRDDIVAELERAKRALEMIDHGVSIQASARSGGREIEAQTAIKRGYLNVLHAREAIARHAADAATLVAADPSRRSTSNSVSTAPSSVV